MKCPWVGPFEINKDRATDSLDEIGDSRSNFVCEVGQFPEENAIEWICEALNEKWKKEQLEQ